MQDERGYPSGRMDPDESLSDESSNDAWYFETPEARWDRQEAKNRALQDAIRSKLRNEPEKTVEPFRSARVEASPEARADDTRRGLFGRSKRDEPAPPAPVSAGPANEDDWSSEPWNAAPAPPAEAKREWVEAPTDEAPLSRWDEMFSAKAGEDDIVDAMRRWADSSNPTADRENLPEDVEARLKALEIEELDDEPAPAPADELPALDPEIEARLRTLEGDRDELAVAMDAPAADDALDPDIEARLKALESEAGDTALAMDVPAADDAFAPDIEARLKALESADEVATPATDEAPPGERPTELDADIARLQAFEADADPVSAAIDEAASWERTAEHDSPRDVWPAALVAEGDDAAPGLDEAAAWELPAAEATPMGPAAAAVPVDEAPDDDRLTEDLPGQSARRWREIFGIEQEQSSPPDPVAELDAEPVTEAESPVSEGFGSEADREAPVMSVGPLGTWDADAPLGNGGSEWIPEFLSPPTATEPAPEPSDEAAPDDDGGWAPVYGRERGEPAPEPAATDESSSAEALGIDEPVASEPQPVADVWASAGTDETPDGALAGPDSEGPGGEHEENPWEPGVLGAAAASVAADEREKDSWVTSFAKDDVEDAWSSGSSLTGVPADASPNWPFAAPDEREPAAATPSPADDDPWAINPVDELEARIKALEDEAAQTAAAQPAAATTEPEPPGAPAPGPSVWPAQQLGSGSAWPAQMNYERPRSDDAELYEEAGVLGTIDEILGDAPPGDQPVVMGHGLNAARFAPNREAEDRTPPGEDAASARSTYLRRPDEFDEPMPDEGTARLLEPLSLVPDEALEAGDDDPDYSRPMPAPSGSDEPSWLTDDGAVEDVEARHGSRAKTLIREIVETGMLAVLVFLAVRASFQNFRVEGESMFPTLEDGEFLIVNRLVYSEVDMEGLSTLLPWIDAEEGETKHLFHGPERGDIVVFRDPRDISDDLIKRVIALPGDTIEIRDGVVYINDLELDEPYITEACTSSCDKTKILIPENEYFVMGDNRNNSHDSRFQDIGLVHEDLIIGKALVSYWPRSAFGLAENEKPHCVGSPDCKPIDGAETEERAEAVQP